MTESESLAFEEGAEGRHGPRDGEVVAMSGGTSAHAMVQRWGTGDPVDGDAA